MQRGFYNLSSLIEADTHNQKIIYTAPKDGDFNLGTLNVDVNSFGISETETGVWFTLFLFELLLP